jgi:uncharacterized protein
MKVAVTVAFFVLAFVSPAFAQSGPSFDCSKASTLVERAICGNPELAGADREMAAIYARLAKALPEPGKHHLIGEQAQWLANRDKACTGDGEDIAHCLKRRYLTRTAYLKTVAEDGDPFIGEQSLLEQGTVGKVSYEIDATWPQFYSSTTDFSAVNRMFSKQAHEAAAEAKPDNSADIDRKQDWSYEQHFSLQRPSADAVAVAVGFSAYSGGAHGVSGTTAYLVDLRTGRTASPETVFAKGDGWLKVLEPLVRADLEKQFEDGKLGFDDAVTPDNLRKLLREPGHYYYRSDRLELIFDAYVVGPYVSGPFTVEIPYSTLKPLLSADGPLGKLRQ